MADLDAQLFRAIHAALSSEPGLLELMIVLSFVGSGWAMLACVPFLAMRRTRSVTAALTLTLVASALLVWAAKSACGRVRPYRCLEGVRCFVANAPTDYSFPSGHAAGAFTFFAFVATLLVREPTPKRLLVCAALLLLAIGVALSRVALGVHFPGDIAAGAALGAAVGHLGARLRERLRLPSR